MSKESDEMLAFRVVGEKVAGFPPVHIPNGYAEGALLILTPEQVAEHSEWLEKYCERCPWLDKADL